MLAASSACAAGYVLAVWLPEADPAFVESPEFLLLVAPVPLGLILGRGVSSRIVLAAVAFAITGAGALFTAFVLLMTGNR